MASGAKRVAAWVMSGVALAAAAVAIAGVLGDWDTTRMWAVAWALAYAEIVWVSIANAVARGAPRLVGWAGAAIALVGLVLTTLFALSSDRPETLFGSMMAADALAALAAIVCQVSLARVSRGSRWIAAFLLVSVTGLDALIVLGLLRVDVSRLAGVFEVFGVLSVLGVVLLGVLHWLGAPRATDARCPRCAEPAAAPTGEFACRACGTRFRVDLLP